MKATGHCPHLSAPVETIEAINSYLYSDIGTNARLLSPDILV
jgi:hypothetical protein